SWHRRLASRLVNCEKTTAVALGGDVGSVWASRSRNSSTAQAMSAGRTGEAGSGPRAGPGVAAHLPPPSAVVILPTQARRVSPVVDARFHSLNGLAALAGLRRAVEDVPEDRASALVAPRGGAHAQAAPVCEPGRGRMRRGAGDRWDGRHAL